MRRDVRRIPWTSDSGKCAGPPGGCPDGPGGSRAWKGVSVRGRSAGQMVQVRPQVSRSEKPQPSMRQVPSQVWP